ncbi:MAG: hypothetical protein H6819_13040 [Phycisphaerales bacterium]|nr:hypothetical protein [Phycisphaerales bacterium]MCB9854438.1 hypothetical protein [Phycisphaerales bacterium]
MPDDHSHSRIESLVNQILKGELPQLTLPEGAAPPIIRVIPIKTTGGARPDGLRDDVQGDPGFSFAVAEGLIEVSRRDLDTGQFEKVHRVLWEAGTDDWMDYSHLNQFEASAVPKDAKVALSFSSASKAAGVISRILAVVNA